MKAPPVLPEGRRKAGNKLRVKKYESIGRAGTDVTQDVARKAALPADGRAEQLRIHTKAYLRLPEQADVERAGAQS